MFSTNGKGAPAPKGAKGYGGKPAYGAVGGKGAYSPGQQAFVGYGAKRPYQAPGPGGPAGAAPYAKRPRPAYFPQGKGYGYKGYGK